MMSLFLGDETVRKGVSNYLNKHKFGNAEQDDLWDSLTKEAHKNAVLPNDLTVKTIMDTWTLQTGYPVITVTRDYKLKNADIDQVSSIIFIPSRHGFAFNKTKYLTFEIYFYQKKSTKLSCKS